MATSVDASTADLSIVNYLTRLFLSMNIFRSLFTSVPRTPMKHQTPPPPTVPAAIKSADEAKAQGLQDGGESLGNHQCLTCTVEVATFASGCFVGLGATNTTDNSGELSTSSTSTTATCPAGRPRWATLAVTSMTLVS